MVSSLASLFDNLSDGLCDNKCKYCKSCLEYQINLTNYYLSV